MPRLAAAGEVRNAELAAEAISFGSFAKNLHADAVCESRARILETRGFYRLWAVCKNARWQGGMLGSPRGAFHMLAMRAWRDWSLVRVSKPQPLERA